MISIEPEAADLLAHKCLKFFLKLRREKKLAVGEFRDALVVLGPYPEKNMALLFEFLETARSLEQGFIFLQCINYS